MVILTDCTFDGLVYDPLQVIEDTSPSSPTSILLWDEAWFAPRCAAPLPQRTAMHSAAAWPIAPRDTGANSEEFREIPRAR